MSDHHCRATHVLLVWFLVIIIFSSGDAGIADACSILHLILFRIVCIALFFLLLAESGGFL